MEALINAGGKGTRMGPMGIEKPMQPIGGAPVVWRAVSAMLSADGISRVVVSVSHNTPETERYLNGMGIETIRTSGEDFMMDLHDAFSVLDGDYVMTCPSDMPLITDIAVEEALRAFRPEMESMIVMVDAGLVRSMGITPSYTREIDGGEWVVSGLSVMDRKGTLEGRYLKEHCLLTDWRELAVNVNTPAELELARSIIG